jgi:hypothetical protein
LDPTNPLTFGLNRYETIRQSADIYTMQNAPALQLQKNANAINGFVGYEVKEKQSEALIAGTHALGSGKVIYLIDNPLFRSFWERGKLLFSNAIYF